MRRLVFENIANGVPIPQIMEALKLSELEVDNAHKFVARKIIQNRVALRQAPIDCHDLRMIRFNRRPLLAVLARIGNLDLSTDILIARFPDQSKVEFGLNITVQALDHPEMVEGAAHVISQGHR